MQDAGCMNCLFYRWKAIYTRGGQISWWPNIEMQNASVGCQRNEKMRSWLLLQQCELHLFASLHQMWPWVRSKVKARLLHHIDETWLIPFYNCTCIIPWLGFQEYNHCNWALYYNAFSQVREQAKCQLEPHCIWFESTICDRCLVRQNAFGGLQTIQMLKLPETATKPKHAHCNSWLRGHNGITMIACCEYFH